MESRVGGTRVFKAMPFAAFDDKVGIGSGVSP